MTHREAVEILQSELNRVNFRLYCFESKLNLFVISEKEINFYERKRAAYKTAIEALEFLERLETPTEIPY